MNVIQIGKRTVKGPAGWEELTEKHVYQLLNWRVRLDSEPTGRFALLQLWYGIRAQELEQLTDEDRADLVALLDFLDVRPERWMLPKLRVNRSVGRTRQYLGPGDGLEHLTFGEFMFAENARIRYAESGAATDLAELLASLYRPKAWLWQPKGEAGRLAFNRQHIEPLKPIMGLVSEPVQKGVLMNYLGCLDRFPVTFPHLFTGSGGGGEGTWLDVGISLARQTSALGTFAQMEQTNLYLVLTTLNAMMKESEDLKAKADKWKS